MGGGSKTTTTNQNEQATTTPQIPAYAQDPIKNFFSGVDSYQQTDPYSFVTPANSLQTGAYQNASGLFGANGLYGDAAAGAKGVMGAAPTTAQASQTMGHTGNLGPAGQASGASLLDNFSAYQNPYTSQVVDTTLADYDRDAELRRGQMVADGARNGAFGGSGYALAQAAFDADTTRGRASTAANLRSNAFNTAAGLSGQDADRRQNLNLFNTGQANNFDLSRFDAGNQMSQFNAGQANQTSQFNAGQQNEMQNQQLSRQLQASGLLGDLASSYGENYRADLGTQLDMGNSLYNLQNIWNQAPLTQLQNVGNLLKDGQIDSISGKTVTGSTSGVEKSKTSGGLFNSLLGLGSLGASVFSDRRLKEDIRKVGLTDGGLPIYTYRYKGDQAVQMGVMAQDVEKSQPQALGPEMGGYMTVNMAEVR
jgi:hypothetical protein